MAPTTTLKWASSRLVHATDLDPLAFAPFGQVIQNPATHHNTPNLQKVAANQGSATKWLDITAMRDHYHLAPSRKSAEMVMNMFVCKPRLLAKQPQDGKDVFKIDILERHPFTPQTFIPLALDKHDRGTCYLVIVAPTLPVRSSPNRSLRDRLLGARSNGTSAAEAGTDRQGPGMPDLDNVRAFIARGDQCVTYGAGTWHAPMVVLGEKDIEFVVVQYANGVAADDCQEVGIESTGHGGLAVVVGNGLKSQDAVKGPRAKL